MPTRAPRHKANRRTIERRPSPSKRGYGATHKAERLAFLMAHPLCEWVDPYTGQRCKQPATEMDHTITLRKLDAGQNTQRTAYCKSHHSKKTCTEDGGLGRMVR